MDVLSAGMCARRRSYFLLFRQKKVTKEKATPLAATLRFAAGTLRCSRAGCAAELTARLRRFVQTCRAGTCARVGGSRGHKCPPYSCPPHTPALLGASRGEWDTTRAIAALGLASSVIPAKAGIHAAPIEPLALPWHWTNSHGLRSKPFQKAAEQAIRERRGRTCAGHQRCPLGEGGRRPTQGG